MLHLKQLLLKEVEMDKTVQAERMCMSNNNYVSNKGVLSIRSKKIES